MWFQQIASNLLLVFNTAASSNEPSGGMVLLQPQEQQRWDELFLTLNSDQNFAFDRIQCAHWETTPCGCKYEDFSTRVDIQCSNQGMLLQAMLVSALPPVIALRSLPEQQAKVPPFPEMTNLVISSLSMNCGSIACEILPPVSFWTSLRLQLGAGWHQQQCQHPCLCEDKLKVFCELDPVSRINSLAKLNLANNQVSGELGFSHLALPRGNPMTAAVTVGVLNLGNNPELHTADFPPFHCVSVPMCDSGAWECTFDLPNCRLDSDLGVWWEIFALLQGRLESGTSCTRDDPCGTCDPSVLRCDRDRIVYLNLGLFAFQGKSQLQFTRLTALKTLILSPDTTSNERGCFDRPLACHTFLPADKFCPESVPVAAMITQQQRQLQARTTRTPTSRPTKQPTLPTGSPTSKPTKSPVWPTAKPTKSPTSSKPTKSPTSSRPTKSPVWPTSRPSKAPTTDKPTKSPTSSRPTKSPSTRPTKSPTVSKPTKSPSTQPTQSPTVSRPTRSPLTPLELAALPKDNFEADLRAWEDLYDALNGPEWFKCRTSRANPCMCRETEKQVSCRTDTTLGGDGVLRIVAIDLSDNSMVGQISSQMINAFTALELVDFSNRPNTLRYNNLTMLESCLRLNLDCNAIPSRCLFTRSNLISCTDSTASPTPLEPAEDTHSPTQSPIPLFTVSPTATASPTVVVITKSPTGVTSSPAVIPTVAPTIVPTTTAPVTIAPTASGETFAPTTKSPTQVPTTKSPTSKSPTLTPTTNSPTSKSPTLTPTTKSPTLQPNVKVPTAQPTQPTFASRVPSQSPTEVRVPTYSPEPEYEPTSAPSTPTTKAPTARPTTKAPTTKAPTSRPSAPTTKAPTSQPTSSAPSSVSNTPTAIPTSTPTPTAPTTKAPTTGTPTNSPGGTSYPTTMFPTTSPETAPPGSPTAYPTTLFPTRTPALPTPAPVPF
ncbi:hypothetical protein BASA81_008860 [Batrachochytrium salamandrivorans]|nr:hypothetical protein BASA81_008860 [Batrachochytrium salamandrivorans]